MAPINKNKQGFALLMSLIVVSVVVSIGLSVLDLTLKQLRLSTNSKDSELAFHAANAGMECARYWRQQESDGFEQHGTVSMTCFNDPATKSITGDHDVDVTAGGNWNDTHSFRADFTWGGANSLRCSKITMVSINSDDNNITEVTNMQDLIPGYPTSAPKVCDPRAHCTVISVRGYSRSCADVDAGVSGIVEREVLLEL